MEERIHDVRELLETAREALLADVRTAALSERVPDAEDASSFRIALAGPYSAGKSLLIAALLRMSYEEAERISAATPHTTRITKHVWRTYELLDLPGTLSGDEQHDALAREGVRSADALMVVSTVELPGVAETQTIRDWLDRDGFRGRCVVVVNKVGSENSDPGVIHAQIADRLGSTEGVRIAFTDARDFVDSLNEPELTESDRKLLSEDSGIGDLERAIEDLFTGEFPPRPVAQLHEVARVLDEGLALWQPTVEEEVMLATADRVQAGIETARNDSADAIERALSTLGDGIGAIGGRLATEVDDITGMLPETLVDGAEQEEEALLDGFDAELNAAFQDAFGRLETELRSALERQVAYAHRLRGSRVSPPIDPLDSNPLDNTFIRGIQRRISEEASGWLKDLTDQGTRPGSPLHDVARKFNRLRRKEIVSHTHIKTAEKMSKSLRAAGLIGELVGPGVDLTKIANDSLRRASIKSRKRDIRRKYVEQAERIVNNERSQAGRYVEQELAPYLLEVAPQLARAEEWRSARDSAEPQLTLARKQIVSAASRFGS